MIVTHIQNEKCQNSLLVFTVTNTNTLTHTQCISDTGGKYKERRDNERCQIENANFSLDRWQPNEADTQTKPLRR